MPDSYGKRQRNQVKARKAAAREERRLDRNRRQADRAAGLSPQPPDGTSPLEATEQDGAAPTEGAEAADPQESEPREEG